MAYVRSSSLIYLRCTCGSICQIGQLSTDEPTNFKKHKSTPFVNNFARSDNKSKFERRTKTNEKTRRASDSTSKHRKISRKVDPGDQFGTLDGFWAPPVEKLEKSNPDVGSIWLARTELKTKKPIGELKKEIPVITQAVTLKHIKTRKQKMEEFIAMHGVDPSKSPVVIECSRKEYNHYLGMKYPPGNVPLMSGHWIKEKTQNVNLFGDWFIIHRTQKAPASLSNVEERFWERHANQLNYDIIANLKRLGFERPTTIQAMAFEAFMNHFNIFIAAEPGSGKTIAYGGPILSHLSKLKQNGQDPKAIILVPTDLLRNQVSASLKSIIESEEDTSVSDLKVLNFYSSNPNCFGTRPHDFDILVTTPNQANWLLNRFKEPLDIQYVVIDEADSLLDDRFLPVLTEFIGIVPFRNSVIEGKESLNGAKVVFCSATCPDELRELAGGIVDEEFLQVVKTDHLHRVQPNVKQKFIRVKNEDKKMDYLTEVLGEDLASSSGKTVIFCKGHGTTVYLHNKLIELGIPNQLIAQDVDFSEARILISDEKAARGIDIPNLRSVVNYDMPDDLQTYIHRVGRVGRCSHLFSRSRVTSFVVHHASQTRNKNELKVINQIEYAVRLGRVLSDVPANVTGKIKEEMANRILMKKLRFDELEQKEDESEMD